MRFIGLIAIAILILSSSSENLFASDQVCPPVLQSLSETPANREINASARLRFAERVLTRLNPAVPVVLTPKQKSAIEKAHLAPTLSEKIRILKLAGFSKTERRELIEKYVAGDLEEGFLLDISENPDDMATYLVYADWLEENGSPQAELIRIQIQLEEVLDPKVRHALETRKEEILKKHKSQFVSHAIRPQTEHDQLSDSELLQLIEYPEFELGLLISFSVRTEIYMKYGEEILRRIPTLRGFKIFRIDRGDLEKINGSPHLSRVKSLALYGSDQPSIPLVTLLQNPKLKNLESLSITIGCGSEVTTAIATSPYLGNLRNLHLQTNREARPAIPTLVASNNLSRLTSLELDGLGNEEVEAIASSQNLSNLTSLNLFGSFGERGISAIATSPHLSRLRSLNLSGSFNNPAVIALTRSANFPNLHSLWISVIHNSQVLPHFASDFLTRGLYSLYLVVDYLDDDVREAFEKSAKSIPKVNVARFPEIF